MLRMHITVQIAIPMLVFLPGCERSNLPQSNATNEDNVRSELTEQVTAFCGDCHSMPDPQSFPKSAWHDEVEQGFNFYFESGRKDLAVPAMHATIDFFRSQAPDSLQFPLVKSTPGVCPVSFQQSSLFDTQGEGSVEPAVSHLAFLKLGPQATEHLLSCDMRSGIVSRLTFEGVEIREIEMAALLNPCHLATCDVDADGSNEIVVADLGSLDPADHDRGRVVLLRRHGTLEHWESAVLADKLGRVADVQPGDFDGDGRVDFVVAEFGWRKTGSILWLRNVSESVDTPKFIPHKIDPRHGAIHVPTCDLNNDGYLDFVALISQEHEVVEVFLNDGTGSFAATQLWSAKDPAVGSSGIELVDLDGDNDLDVLYTSGDTFDSRYVKPSHGVRWLRNDGGYPFTEEVLTGLAGAYRALPGDLDEDGDLDIVAVSFLPQGLLSQENIQMDSIVLLEQTTPGTFVRHVVEGNNPHHATFEMGDFDRDGDLDLAVGSFTMSAGDRISRVTVWSNESRKTSP